MWRPGIVLLACCAVSTALIVLAGFSASHRRAALLALPGSEGVRWALPTRRRVALRQAALCPEPIAEEEEMGAQDGLTLPCELGRLGATPQILCSRALGCGINNKAAPPKPEYSPSTCCSGSRALPRWHSHRASHPLAYY
jgi:hypothetical protein